MALPKLPGAEACTTARSCPRCGSANINYGLKTCALCRRPLDAPEGWGLREHDDPQWRPHGPFVLLKDECSFIAPTPEDATVRLTPFNLAEPETRRT